MFAPQQTRPRRFVFGGLGISRRGHVVVGRIEVLPVGCPSAKCPSCLSSAFAKGRSHSRRAHRGPARRPSGLVFGKSVSSSSVYRAIILQQYPAVLSRSETVRCGAPRGDACSMPAARNMRDTRALIAGPAEDLARVIDWHSPQRPHK